MRRITKQVLPNTKICCLVTTFVTYLVSLYISLTITQKHINTPLLDPTNTELKEVSSLRKYTEMQKTPLRILCTSNFCPQCGSFKLRCNDFQRIVEMYFSDIAVVHALPSNKLEQTKGQTFDATILVKTITMKTEKRFGHIFVDVADAYNIHEKKIAIPNDWTIIAQNSLQAAFFSQHTSIIVPHWFVSFNSDKESEMPPMDKVFGNDTFLIKEKHAFHFDTSRLNGDNTIFKMAMVMDSKQCDITWVKLPESVTFDCIHEINDILYWYKEYLDITHGEKNIIIQELGKGYLYRKLFHQYDALIVSPKPTHDKLQYNCMQRAVSQMRSGVPVILGCYGGAHEEFCHQHKYSCTYTKRRGSFEEIVAKMKNSPALRRQCQKEGFEISKLYSPKKVVWDYLQKIYETIHKNNAQIYTAKTNDK